MPRRSRPHRLAMLAWSLNLAGAAALLAVLGLYYGGKSARAGGGATMPLEEGPGMSSARAPLAWGYLPTVTPNPRATPIILSSPTPFILQGGGRPRVIGTSVAGRALELYQFGTGPRKRMIVGGIHGGHEWNTIALADQIIAHVDANPDVIPADVTLYILRDLNPDGDARAHSYLGRVNDRGVDLNRNFPVNWQKEWDRDGCWDLVPTTAGAEPGSEPETRALMGFLLTHPVEVLISLHSAALGVFPGGVPWDADSVRFAKTLAAVTDYPFPPIETGCVYTGTLADYAVSRGATAVDMELSNHEDTDFDRNLDALQVLLKWNREP